MPKVMPPGSSLHYQGTVRMGAADDGTASAAPNSRVWGVPGLVRRRQRRHPDRRLACNPTLTSVALAVARRHRRLAPLDARPASEGELTVLEFPVIQGRGFRNVVEAAGSPASRSSCATPTTAAARPACSTASRSSSTASGSPTTCRCGRCRAARSPSTSCARRPTSAGSSTSRATITVPKPGGLSVGRAPPRGHDLPAPLLLPAADRPVRTFTVAAAGRDRPAGARGRPASTASPPTATPATSTRR